MIGIEIQKLDSSDYKPLDNCADCDGLNRTYNKEDLKTLNYDDTMTEYLSDPFSLLYDKLFFGVYSRKPHAVVEDFIRKHTSLLRELPKDTESEWITYPPGHEEDKWQFITRSIQLTEHPFYVFDFWRAKLDVHNSESKDQICSQDMKLTFEFLSKKDAFTAFDCICTAFEPVSTKRQKVVARHLHDYLFKQKQRGRELDYRCSWQRQFSIQEL